MGVTARVVVDEVPALQRIVADEFTSAATAAVDARGTFVVAVPGGSVVQDEVSGGPSWLIRGDLYFEAPTGVWKPGTYTLVLKNKTMDVALPFSLPAGELKKDPNKGDDKVVPW